MLVVKLTAHRTFAVNVLWGERGKKPASAWKSHKSAERNDVDAVQAGKLNTEEKENRTKNREQWSTQETEQHVAGFVMLIGSKTRHDLVRRRQRGWERVHARKIEKFLVQLASLIPDAPSAHGYLARMLR